MLTHTDASLSVCFHIRECPDDEAEDGPIAELRTVKQQLALIRRKQLTGVPHDTHTELIVYKLNAEQRKCLQQQLQQVNSTLSAWRLRAVTMLLP